MSKPIHQHDCDRCVFLGTLDQRDLYFCPGEPTVIARRSSDPPDYQSGLVFGLTSLKDRPDNYLRAAYQLACDRGLIEGPKTEGAYLVHEDALVGAEVWPDWEFSIEPDLEMDKRNEVLPPPQVLCAFCATCAVEEFTDTKGRWQAMYARQAMRSDSVVRCDNEPCRRPLLMPEPRS